MADKCECGSNGGLQLVFSCSGAADTAELADRAARKVHRSGEARMYCLAGVGGVGAGGQRLAVRVTDLGFEKGQTPVTDESIDRLAAKVRAAIRPVDEA